MQPVIISDPQHWPTRIASLDGNVYIECGRPKEGTVDQVQWIEALSAAVQSLSGFQRLGVSGDQAVAALFKELPRFVVEQAGIRSIAYVDSGRVYSWPQPESGSHRRIAVGSDVPELPFGRHRWQPLPLYRGNYGPVSDVQFRVSDAALIRRDGGVQTWFILLEAWVNEQGNDAILQKTAFAKVAPDGTYTVHEDDEILENAGGGGPYDWIMSDLVVTARGDIIAGLPNHWELGNVLVTLDLEKFRADQIDTFQAPSPELAPVVRDVDVEVMKYLRRFPDHVLEMPGHSFERIIGEILASHGFSDIQLNVRNRVGEIDILAFERTREGQRVGYIIECKRYRRDRKVSLREAHVLAAKMMHMKSEGFDKAMLVTTSDFTEPAKQLYDSAWGLELKAYDEVVEWLRHYKPPKEGYYL